MRTRIDKLACCICFRCLYGGRNQSEALCVLLCSVWCGLWFLVISSETLYDAISVPVWAAMLVLSFAYLVYTLCRGQKTIYKTWEAKASWN